MRAAAASGVLLILMIPAPLWAQDTTLVSASPLVVAAGLALLGLLPFVLVLTTSFAKFAVVLSILRSALGTQNVPPNVVLASLALILTGFVMAPVLGDIRSEVAPLIDPELSALSDPDRVEELGLAALGPLKGFLAANAGVDELALFAQLRAVEMPSEVSAAPLSVVVPAFAITELVEAF